MFKEKNVVLKNFRKVDIRVASCYPNIYRTAMSSLGYAIIYDMLNNMDDVYCERVIYPSVKSIETNSPLSDFDIISFTVQYEEDYFNILKMLKSANIPLRKDDRGDNHPLIIAGGPCITSNPLPMSPFIDLAIIGEAELILPKLINKTIENKNNKIPIKKDLLIDDLLSIHGIFRKGHKTKKMIVSNMKDAWHPTKFIVTETDEKDFIPVFGDSILLEVSRGCTRGCRFCMAGYMYRPQRETPLNKLIDICEKSREETGFNKVSLIGAAVSDYSNIDKLSSNLMEMGFHVSTPSLRIESITDELLSSVVKSGIKSITLAPESTQRIRNSLNKNIEDDLIIETIKKSLDFELSVKLYFIIANPFEEEKDLEELKEFMLKIRSLTNNPYKIKFSVNPLIPKPHTPLQWEGFDLKSVKNKIKFIKNNVKNTQIKFESPKKSLIQYVLSCKGDEISNLIENSVNTNVPISQWNKFSKGYELESKLPWNDINIGIKKDFLLKERENLIKSINTPWCNENPCYKCGSCE